MKKEFTETRPKEFNEKSDIELIEELDKGTYTDTEINVIKAILDKRMKRSIQNLTDVTKISSEKTEKYSQKLISLTWILAILTIFLVMIAAFQFILFLRYQLPLSRLEAQRHIQGVIENCKIDPNTTWVDQSGKVHGCLEIPEEWLQKNKK